MVLELKNLFMNEGGSLPLDTELDFSAIGYHTGEPFGQPVTLKGGITNRVGIVRINAVAHYCFDAPCDRCGEPTEAERDCAIRHILVYEQNTDSDDFLLVPDMRLDLDDLVLSDVLLSLPAKHLCDEECRGVCPQCRKNRNTGECDCTDFDSDF